MKHAALIFFLSFAAGCIDFDSTGPSPELGIVAVNVHYQQGIAGIPVTIVQTGDSTTTGANGIALFSLPAGAYVVRVYGINRGGPIGPSVDFNTEAIPGEVVFVDVVDCLPCL
jgi:hypothetical protein